MPPLFAHPGPPRLPQDRLPQLRDAGQPGSHLGLYHDLLRRCYSSHRPGDQLGRQMAADLEVRERDARSANTRGRRSRAREPRDPLPAPRRHRTGLNAPHPTPTPTPTRTPSITPRAGLVFGLDASIAPTPPFMLSSTPAPLPGRLYNRASSSTLSPFISPVSSFSTPLSSSALAYNLARPPHLAPGPRMTPRTHFYSHAPAAPVDTAYAQAMRASVHARVARDIHGPRCRKGEKLFTPLFLQAARTQIALYLIAGVGPAVVLWAFFDVDVI